MTARPSRPGGLSSAGPALPPALPRPGRLGPGSCGRAGGSGVSGVSRLGVPSRSRARPALTIAPAPLRPSRNPPGAGTAPATAPAKGQESPERGRAALLGLGFNPRATRAGSKRSDNNQTDRHLFLISYFLFQSCASLGAPWSPTNQAPQLSIHFTIYAFTKQRNRCSLATST